MRGIHLSILFCETLRPGALVVGWDLEHVAEVGDAFWSWRELVCTTPLLISPDVEGGEKSQYYDNV
jgi:hypothetical protein